MAGPSQPKRTTSSPKLAGLERRLVELESLLERERRTNAALRDVAQALGTPVDLDRLLELVLAKSAELLDGDRATLYLLDEASGDLVSQMVIGENVQTIRVAVGQGIAGSVVKTGHPIRVRDAYDDTRFSPDWDTLTGYKTRSILAVPLKSHLGQTIGVLQVLNKRSAEEFSDDDETLLGSLATQAGISIDNAKLFLSVVHKNVQLHQAQESLKRRVADLKLLFDLESAMVRAGDAEDMVHAVLRETVRATHTRIGALLLLGPGKGDKALYRLHHDRQETLEGTVPETLQGTLGRAFRDQTVLKLHELSDQDGDVTDLGVTARSVIAVPLTGEHGEAVGAMGLYDRLDEREFTDEDLGLLRLIAANVSTAVNLLRARESRAVTERLSTIGRLLSSVLHDLKTPMTVIAGYAQLLSTTDDPAKRTEYAELILKQFEHITAMQREVLAFAQGKRSLLLSRVYLTKFFGDIRAHVEHEIEGRPIQFDMNLQDRGTARFDEVKMTRALHNLVRNSIDAMGEGGGTLSIDVRRAGDDLLIGVSDTGPGIPPEIEGHLFESFVTVGKETGTGLGLAVVKKVVEEHGGRVAAMTSPRGAIFTIRLPQSTGK